MPSSKSVHCTESAAARLRHAASVRCSNLNRLETDSNPYPVPATANATNAYASRYPGLHFSTLGRTGWRVSGAGFGGYRVSVGVDEHRSALRRALLSGINLVDTSTNYADGGSEELLAQVLGELVVEKAVARDEIVIVTKAGYMQGSNLAVARERVASGSGFPDVVEYGDSLWHCIAPEFLDDQLSRSLDRMRLAMVDVLLLHNPEYYLGWAHHEGVPLETAREEYYRRIRLAFDWLEQEVRRGRIAHYGISSNTFGAQSDSPTFTSLDRVIDIAESISSEHHFSVIQFPANLLERGFVETANQPDGATLLERARRAELGTLANRPLNAIVDDRLVRLADFPLASIDTSPEAIDERIDRIAEREFRFLGNSAPALTQDAEESRALSEFLSVGSLMHQHWRELESIETVNELLSQHIAPRLGWVGQFLRTHGDDVALSWFDAYVGEVRELMERIGAYYSVEAQQRSDAIRAELEREVGVSLVGPLSQLAIRRVLGAGVDTVLVGMRREHYVRDVLRALRDGPLVGR